MNKNSGIGGVQVGQHFGTFVTEQTIEIDGTEKWGDVAKAFVELVIERHDGNKTEAAKSMGVSKRTLQRYVKMLKTKDKGWRPSLQAGD